MTNCSGGDGSITRGGDVFSRHYILFLLCGTRGIIVFSSRYEILLFIIFFLPNTNMISPLCPTTMTVDTFSPTLYIISPVHIIISLFAHHVYFLPNGFVDAYNHSIGTQ